MTPCPNGRAFAAVVVASVLACSAQDANAQANAPAVGDFYRDKQMQIIVRSSPGGSYDLYSRLVATHMMKYIPGNPTFITRYMTGAAGIQAVNFVENVAPKDGTVFTIVSNGLPADQALDLADGLKAWASSTGSAISPARTR
jgi:tripartite-type tricarboxylate transporter receptor subunit TctC